MCDQKEEEELKEHQKFKEEEKEVGEEYQEEEGQEVEEEEVNDDDDYSSISLFQIIIIALALFLATNGPTNYPLLWNQLTNPPVDSRHAIRNGNSGTIPISPHMLIPIQTIQMKEYALGVQQSLETNVANAENRIALVNRMFGDLALDDKKSGEMAELLVGMNMTNVKNYFLQLQDFSLKNFQNEVGGKELHEKIMERWIKFVDNIIHIHKQL
uniref:Uncharacterized protein n=2 Tax=Meloidogyne TaxID=189290 RepID=A0A6V7XET3_MELEN|nr:unnamed protein product [Meloidogyne enterolobii]CAD2197763.1 unnamed protein product [Meloidogyne enterolobii]